MKSIKERLNAISSDSGLQESEAVTQLILLNKDLHKQINKQENPGFFQNLGREINNQIHEWRGGDAVFHGVMAVICICAFLGILSFITVVTYTTFNSMLNPPTYSSYFMVGGTEKIKGNDTECYSIWLECKPECKSIRSSGCIQDSDKAVDMLIRLNDERK